MTVQNDYYQYCAYRLPCGICTWTNTYCPMQGITTLTWMQTNADLTHSNTCDALANTHDALERKEE